MAAWRNETKNDTKVEVGLLLRVIRENGDIELYDTSHYMKIKLTASSTPSGVAEAVMFRTPAGQTEQITGDGAKQIRKQLMDGGLIPKQKPQQVAKTNAEGTPAEASG